MNLFKLCICAALSLLLGACASLDENSSRRFSPNVTPPVSILVLPPLNLSNDHRASYSFLSTVSEPLGEIGYYVLPVAVVDAYLKANGLPNPYQMHQVPVQKYNEILGADAVLYIEIDRYGQEFNLISSSTVVSAKAKLISAHTKERLWNGSVRLSEESESGKSITSAIINAVVSQVIKANQDLAHPLSRDANWRMIDGYNGLPIGPNYRCETERCTF